VNPNGYTAQSVNLDMDLSIQPLVENAIKQGNADEHLGFACGLSYHLSSKYVLNYFDYCAHQVFAL
jgi:hypothetical protein